MSGPPIPYGTYPGGPQGGYAVPGQPYPSPGYPPPAGAYPPPAGYPLATTPGYAPQYLPPGAQGYPPSSYGAPSPQGYPPAPGYASAPGPTAMGYAPPPGPPPIGFPPQGPGYYANPAFGAEPPTVFYRGDIMINNPRFGGGIQRYPGIEQDIEAILTHRSKKHLIDVMVALGTLKMDAVSQEFPMHHGNKKRLSLLQYIEKECSGELEAGLCGLALGPVKYDAHLIHLVTKDAGDVLNELILDLSPFDLSLLSYTYQQMHGTNLSAAIHSRTDSATKKLFAAVLSTERRILPDASTPNVMQLAAEDAAVLYKAGAGRMGTDEAKFHDILTNRTAQHITQICREYHQNYKKTLSQAIDSEFSGLERKALLYIVRGCEPDARHPELNPAAVRDALMLEKTMEGMGTKERLLVVRLVRAHWSRARLERIKAAFPHQNSGHRHLRDRVHGETSGNLKELCEALAGGPM